MLHIHLWGYRTANPPSHTHPGRSIIINNTAAEVEHSILTSCAYTLSSTTLGQYSIITKHTCNELDIHDFYTCRQRVLMQYVNSAVCFSEEQLSLTLRTLISDFNSEKLFKKFWSCKIIVQSALPLTPMFLSLFDFSFLSVGCDFHNIIFEIIIIQWILAKNY